MYEQIKQKLTRYFEISESYAEYRYMVNIVCQLNKNVSKRIIYGIAQDVAGFEVSM